MFNLDIAERILVIGGILGIVAVVIVAMNYPLSITMGEPGGGTIAIPLLCIPCFFGFSRLSFWFFERGRNFMGGIIISFACCLLWGGLISLCLWE